MNFKNHPEDPTCSTDNNETCAPKSLQELREIHIFLFYA